MESKLKELIMTVCVFGLEKKATLIRRVYIDLTGLPPSQG